MKFPIFTLFPVVLTILSVVGGNFQFNPFPLGLNGRPPLQQVQQPPQQSYPYQVQPNSNYFNNWRQVGQLVLLPGQLQNPSPKPLPPPPPQSIPRPIPQLPQQPLQQIPQHLQPLSPLPPPPQIYQPSLLPPQLALNPVSVRPLYLIPVQQQLPGLHRTQPNNQPFARKEQPHPLSQASPMTKQPPPVNRPPSIQQMQPPQQPLPPVQQPKPPKQHNPKNKHSGRTTRSTTTTTITPRTTNPKLVNKVPRGVRPTPRRRTISETKPTTTEEPRHEELMANGE